MFQNVPYGKWGAYHVMAYVALHKCHVDFLSTAALFARDWWSALHAAVLQNNRGPFIYLDLGG